MKKFTLNLCKLITVILVMLVFLLDGRSMEITQIEPVKILGKQTIDETYTIRIENNKPGHVYKAYQVFSGDLYINEVNIPILSNIEWGNNFQKYEKELIKELQKIDELNSNITNFEKAEDIAKFLETQLENQELVDKFTIIIAKFIENNQIEPTKLADWSDYQMYYEISELDSGYYIVIDSEVKEEDDSYSKYLIDVVRDINMHVKSSTPFLRKNVIGNNINYDATRNTATYKALTGNREKDYDIKFELYSNVPDVDYYNTYKFVVTDILSKGFDYDEESLRITVGGNEYPKTRIDSNNQIVNCYEYEYVTIDEENYETYKKYLEENILKKEEYYGKTIIIIEFNDFVGQVKDNFVHNYEDILIKYNAKLNGMGETGKKPNINQAYLTFSNNPYNEESTGKTKIAETYTYTVNLDILKIAEIVDIRDDKFCLSGAEFEIYDAPEYIKNELGIKVKNENRNLIAKIISGAQFLNKEGNIIEKEGHAIYSSLGEGTYYIKEVKAPDGYNKLKEEIELQIKTKEDGYGLSWSSTVNSASNLVFTSVQKDENLGEPYVELQVENTKGFQLPNTGGDGIGIFILVGSIIMIVVATIYIKTNKKKEQIYNN